MKKFIISDLHGNGEIYNTIISYLENLSNDDDITLYINGDLIDRGLDTFYMLNDVYERCHGKGNIKINYLGGNHELMFYHACKSKKRGKPLDNRSDWIRNGGWILKEELNLLEDEITYKFQDFIGNLKIYEVLPDKIKKNQILLVHAAAPRIIKSPCDLFIKDDTYEIEKAVWKREDSLVDIFGPLASVIPVDIGKKGYLTIIGHTPIKNQRGFIYNKQQNYLNIDGGCAAYAIRHFDYNHVPLVEVNNGYLTILIFNHNNEIIDGYYFDGSILKMEEEKLKEKRQYINHSYDNCEEYKKKLILSKYSK